tara:strand:- start:463 stop:636 length:174 start_codon:yes stop_codon:yes gene_type:complete
MNSDKTKNLADALKSNLLKRKKQKKLSQENADRFRKKNIGISTLLENDSIFNNEKKD